jgi:hypothetical protein
VLKRVVREDGVAHLRPVFFSFLPPVRGLTWLWGTPAAPK